jgi:hypothetical protein
MSCIRGKGWMASGEGIPHSTSMIRASARSACSARIIEM